MVYRLNPGTKSPFPNTNPRRRASALRLRRVPGGLDGDCGPGDIPGNLWLVASRNGAVCGHHPAGSGDSIPRPHQLDLGDSIDQPRALAELPLGAAPESDLLPERFRRTNRAEGY